MKLHQFRQFEAPADAPPPPRWRGRYNDAGQAQAAAMVEERYADVMARFRARAGDTPPDALPIAPDPAGQGASAAARRRIGWYVPERHRLDSLEECPAPTATRRCMCEGVHHYVVRDPTQRQALNATRAWVEAVAAGRGPCLALIGSVGTGKSSLMYAAVTALNLRGIHCGAWGWYDLAMDLRDAKVGDERARLTRDRVLASQAMCLDEIRPTSGTGFDATELAGLMTRAYREAQAVFVTSQYADDALVEIIGMAASSRLTQQHVRGPDYRQQDRPQAVA